MTNAEKFREVFGFYPDAHPTEDVCNYVFCDTQDCATCRYYKGNEESATWDDEYVEVCERR